MSKWERGESLPDFFIIYKLAEIFGVATDDLTMAEQRRIADNTPQKKKKRLLINIMSVVLVWLVMSVAFFVLEVIDFKILPQAIVFVYALPCSFIVSLVFSCLWWGIPAQCVTTSGIIWSTALCVYLSFRTSSVGFIFITAAILQILAILWFIFRSYLKNNKIH